MSKRSARQRIDVIDEKISQLYTKRELIIKDAVTACTHPKASLVAMLSSPYGHPQVSDVLCKKCGLVEPINSLYRLSKSISWGESNNLPMFKKEQINTMTTVVYDTHDIHILQYHGVDNKFDPYDKRMWRCEHIRDDDRD